MICHPPPAMSHFGVVSSPILPPYGLIIWRLFGFAYSATVLIRSIDRYTSLCLIYLSVQSLVFSTIYFLVAAAVSFHYVKWNPAEPPRAYEVITYFQAICVPIGIIVIIGFWIFFSHLFDVLQLEIHGVSLQLSPCRNVKEISMTFWLI